MKLVPLETYPNEVEAVMMAQILDSEGITTVVKPMGAGYGALGVIQWIHHRVYVDERNLATAKQIIEQTVIQPDFESEGIDAS